MEIPQWHKAILDKRLLEVKSGKAIFLDFDEALDEILKELDQ